MKGANLCSQVPNLMKRIIDVFYTYLALPALRMIFLCASMFNVKARKRLNEEPRSLAKASTIPKRAPRIVFHAASMGELEQCVPVMQALGNGLPAPEIFVSCTSSSGYEHALRLNGVLCALYLPLDTPSNAVRFFNATQPDVFVINRYDVWPNHLREAHKRGITIHLINATMPTAGTRTFLRPWMRSVYRLITTVTAVSETDATWLSNFIGSTVHALPDTRIDRVLERINTADPSIVAYRRSDVTTLLIGSSWPADEDVVIDAVTSLNDASIRLVIVPHEPSEQALQRIEQRIPVTRLSLAFPTTSGHILVDTVGKLLSLYSIANAAFVGGGFGAGVHSVIEPAGYGLPIATGPSIERSRDACALMAQNVLTVTTTAQETLTWLETCVINTVARSHIGAKTRAYVLSTAGSSLLYSDLISKALTERSQSDVIA